MDNDKSKKAQPEKNEPDFYMENGFMVFTASYHLKRGYCCKNGCRHCPYGFKKA
jgi:hypothetical protein